MKNFQFIAFLMAILFTATSCEAKIKNPKTESYKVYGNCDMCKNRIETAVYINAEAKGEWDEKSKMLSVTYDSLKTNADVILKRIADVGHDNDKFIADNEVYKKLPKCCQYTRKEVAKAPTDMPIPTDTIAVVTTTETPTTAVIEPSRNEVKTQTKTATPPVPVSTQNDVKAQLNALLQLYYPISNALIEGNDKEAAKKAAEFETALNKIDMKSMTPEEHTFYMPIHEKLVAEIKAIKTAPNLDKMRENFDAFSINVFKVMKEFKANKGEAMYYQYCPMKKTYWISKEEAIKNPYYGSEMLTCGSVKETVK